MQEKTANKKLQLTAGSATRFHRSFLYQNLVRRQSTSASGQLNLALDFLILC